MKNLKIYLAILIMLFSAGMACNQAAENSVPEPVETETGNLPVEAVQESTNPGDITSMAIDIVGGVGYETTDLVATATTQRDFEYAELWDVEFQSGEDPFCRVTVNATRDIVEAFLMYAPQEELAGGHEVIPMEDLPDRIIDAFGLDEAGFRLKHMEEAPRYWIYRRYEPYNEVEVCTGEFVIGINPLSGDVGMIFQIERDIPEDLEVNFSEQQALDIAAGVLPDLADREDLEIDLILIPMGEDIYNDINGVWEISSGMDYFHVRADTGEIAESSTQ